MGAPAEPTGTSTQGRPRGPILGTRRARPCAASVIDDLPAVPTVIAISLGFVALGHVLTGLDRVLARIGRRELSPSSR